MIIYLDESGDLGFDFKNKNPSRKFVITLLVCGSSAETRSFKVAVRKTLRNKLNKGKKGSRVVQELKGTGTTLEIKKYFYRHSPKRTWSIYTVCLNKERVYDYLTTSQGKKKLYNFIARFLIDKVDLSDAGNAVTLVVDKSKNKNEIADFNKYIGNQLDARLPLEVPLNIYHEHSHSNAGLQTVDLFCWGVFRKYERNDLEWYNVYRNRIAVEEVYL